MTIEKWSDEDYGNNGGVIALACGLLWGLVIGFGAGWFVHSYFIN